MSNVLEATQVRSGYTEGVEILQGMSMELQ